MIEKILLVEDNNMNCKLVLHGLKNYKVDVAKNGQEAIDLYRLNEYDIVLMDIQMPVVNGIEAARKIRQIESERISKRYTIILGMTASWIPNLLEECEAAGINDFLRKPFNPLELPQIIADFYSRYSELIEFNYQSQLTGGVNAS